MQAMSLFLDRLLVEKRLVTGNSCTLLLSNYLCILFCSYTVSILRRYGYVMPDDAPTLLEQHIEKGQVVDLLWRLV